MNKDTVEQIMNHMNTNWDKLSQEWCTCSEDVALSSISGGYTFYCPPNLECPLCKVSINNDHYHCGVCAKISQVG